LEKQDTFSDRLILLLFHFAFFIKNYKSEITKVEMQNLFDFVIKQIELSIREIGHGDVSVNKKMKDCVNLFYSIANNTEQWNSFNFNDKSKLFNNFLNIDKNLDFFVKYFDKYDDYLSKNTLNTFTKDILNSKFSYGCT